MNKKIILGFIIVSLLLIVGCSGGSKGKAPITDIDVRTGTDGLIMEFSKNAPPESTFEESIFPIALNLKNQGAFDIGDESGEIFKKSGFLVFGFETSLVDLSEDQFKRMGVSELEKILFDEFEEFILESGFDDLDLLLLEEFKSKIANDPKMAEEFENIFVDNIGKLLDEYKILAEGDSEKYKRIMIEFLNFLNVRQQINIRGKSIFNPNGDRQLVTTRAQTKKIGSQSESQSSTILATACYPYKTIFGASVCIDTDIYGIRRESKACKITDLKFSEGQGAPVAITKIETRMLPQDRELIKPHFLIHIQNKGNGEVVGLDKVEEACTSKALDYTAFNTILITATLSGKSLDCRLNNRTDPPPPAPATIRLRNKGTLVRCTLVGSDDELIDINRDAYKTPLSIELEYGYTFTISKDIIIEKVLTY